MITKRYIINARDDITRATIFPTQAIPYIFDHWENHRKRTYQIRHSLGKAYNVKDIRWEMCAALTVWPASTTRHGWRE